MFKFLKKLFQKQEYEIQECPSDWNLTVDDLFNEMETGKRKSVGMPELEWARKYTKSLFPEETRFPAKGDVYESLSDQEIYYITSYKAPFTRGGTGILYQGEKIWIDIDPSEEKPIAVYALPIKYDEIEKRMISTEERKNKNYSGFYFSFNTTDLIQKFKLIDTNYKCEE